MNDRINDRRGSRSNPRPECRSQDRSSLPSTWGKSIQVPPSCHQGAERSGNAGCVARRKLGQDYDWPRDPKPGAKAGFHFSFLCRIAQSRTGSAIGGGMFAVELLRALNIMGTFVFGLSGAMVAVRRRLNVFGGLVVAVATGVAGGMPLGLNPGAGYPGRGALQGDDGHRVRHVARQDVGRGAPGLARRSLCIGSPMRGQQAMPWAVAGPVRDRGGGRLGASGLWPAHRQPAI